MPDFSSRDPLDPAFWDERFAHGFTPWDRAGVPQQYAAFLTRQRQPGTLLIPGCGAAYELAHGCAAGWQVCAIDFSPVAVQTARARLGVWAEHVQEADFFTWQPAQALDVIYERAFLCALPPAMWPRVAARWAELLGPGALLAGYFFFDDAAKGPPFGISATQLDDLLEENFVRLEDAGVTDSIPVFEGKERWRVYQRA